MTDAIDDELRRRFAQAPSAAGDEIFVAAVRRRVLRRRRLQLMWRVALALGFSCAVAALAPGLLALASMAGEGALLLGGGVMATTSSLPGMLILGALGVAGCVLAWVARRT
jgi:hypothetical protein